MFGGFAVVVTIGPACQDVETLCKLLEAGATCARCDLTVDLLLINSIVHMPGVCKHLSSAVIVQWGPLDFHKQSLANLQKAMHKTRKLCAIIIDTIGREILVNREAKLDERGWPIHEQALSVKVNDKVAHSSKTIPPHRASCAPKEPGSTNLHAVEMAYRALWRVVQIKFTTKNIEGGSINDGLLPISYPKFPSMCVRGDTIFLGKYLVTGSEDCSLYLTVRSFLGPPCLHASCAGSTCCTASAGDVSAVRVSHRNRAERSQVEPCASNVVRFGIGRLRR